MSFQESFSNISSEQFKNGVCRLYVQNHPFTLKAVENNIEVQFPFNKKYCGLVYSLSDIINSFFNDNPGLLQDISDADSISNDYPKDTAIVNNSTQPKSEKASVMTRKIITHQNESDSKDTLSEGKCVTEMFSHEWDGMFYYISFYVSQNDEAAALCLKLLENIAEFLKDNNIDPDTCVFCGDAGAQKGFIIEGALCAAHERCTSERSSKRPAARAIFAYLAATAFCAIAALTFIPLCRLGIMPSLAGIPMGLLAALGFWLTDKKYPPSRWIMLIIYIVLSGAANFCGDYLYLINSQPQFDFIATFTYSLNIVNAIFDIICCVVIAHFSSIIIYDLLYKRFSIIKPGKKQLLSAQSSNKSDAV